MRKALSFLLAFLLPVTLVAAQPNADPKPVWGDVSLDGFVASTDALLALQCATDKIDLTEQQRRLADVNADGGVTSSDALLILQYATLKVSSFPVASVTSSTTSSTTSTSASTTTTTTPSATTSTTTTTTTTTTAPTTPPEEPYDPGYRTLETKKIEAESGEYPETCSLVNHSGGTSIGHTSAGNQYRYTLTVEKSGYYLVSYSLSVISDVTLSLSADGGDSLTLTPAVTNSWSTYYTNISDGYLYLSSGEHELVFEQSKAGLNFDWFSLTYLAEHSPQEIPSAYPVQAAFTSTVAQKDTPLPLTVSGLESDGKVLLYIWKIQNRLIATTSLYAPSALTLWEIDGIQVWPVLEIQEKTYFTTASGSFTTYVSDPLPVITIDTENAAAIVSKEDYLSANMTIQADGAPDAQLYSGKIEIRGRGNSTWDMYPKKPYKIKLDKKDDLFGMGENKHWVLLANYRDRTLMRNRLAFDLSAHLGLPTTSSVFVKVVLNGEDIGVYELCEQVRVGETRVDIIDWEDEAEDETDLSSLTSANGYDTTGGFLIEINSYYDEISKFTTSHDVPITVKSPEYLNTNEEMFQYLTGYIQDFEDAVYADDFTNDKGQHYSDLFDVDSLVNYWLVNEFMGNLDSGSFSSTYMYKGTGGDKFHMGPVWDFDSSSGNYLDHSKESDPQQWVPGRQGKWYRQLYRDKTFIARLRDCYWENRDYLATMPGQVEEYYTQLYTHAAADHEYWSLPTSYSYDCELLMDWLSTRLEWMDQQFETVDTAYASLNG